MLCVILVGGVFFLSVFAAFVYENGAFVDYSKCAFVLYLFLHFNKYKIIMFSSKENVYSRSFGLINASALVSSGILSGIISDNKYKIKNFSTGIDYEKINTTGIKVCII